jgi:ADP-ribosylglycohydrolase
MLGAIIGDIVGSVYEFANINDKNFPLFSEESKFTDDTVMTVAVADGLMNSIGLTDIEAKDEVSKSMYNFGNAYPYAGYGSMFIRWLEKSNGEAYCSYGNGSAMRVSAAGWLANNLEDALKYAKISALPTHNHPEGIKGAQAIAHAIYLARHGATKTEIKSVMEDDYKYDVSLSISDITKLTHGDEICQITVPESLICFFDGNSFEDVIRNSIAIGGDSDTIAAIAGSVAEAYYGIPESIKDEALPLLDQPLKDVVTRFNNLIAEQNPVSIIYYDTGEVKYRGGGYPSEYDQKLIRFGNGIEYYKNGTIKYEGFFIWAGLIRGKQYYKSGQLKFEGDYHDKRTDGNYYGPTYPIQGRFYSRSGKLIYDGVFTKTSGGLGYPKIVFPDGFGSI